MKKLALVIVVLMGVSTTNGVLASGLPVLNPKKTMVLKEESEGILRFSLKSENLEKNSYLVIKNRAGDVVYDQNIKGTPSFSKILDLSALPASDYVIYLHSGKELLTKSFKITKEKIRKGYLMFSTVEISF